MSHQVLVSDRSQRPAEIPPWKRFFSPANRYLSPLLITCILLVGQLSYGILESYTRTLLAIVTSLVAEMILSRLYLGKWPNLASAYISGISVGILARSPAFPLYPCTMRRCAPPAFRPEPATPYTSISTAPQHKWRGRCTVASAAERSRLREQRWGR